MIQTDQSIGDYIVYTDDDEDDRQFLEDSFNKSIKNLRLFTLPGGNELIEFLEKNETALGFPCLIVLDQNMPKLMGEDIIIILRANKKYGKIPIVIFSTSRLPLPAASRFNVPIEQKPLNLADWEKIPFRLLNHCGHIGNNQSK